MRQSGFFGMVVVGHAVGKLVILQLEEQAKAKPTVTCSGLTCKSQILRRGRLNYRPLASGLRIGCCQNRRLYDSYLLF